MERKHPMPHNVLMRVENMGEYDDGEPDRPDNAPTETRFVTTDLDAATVVTSLTVWSTEDRPMHRPVLDIDFGASLVPSSTPGHFHLYLDRMLTWEQYCELLDVLAKLGILEQGYVSASKMRGHTAARLPWVIKGACTPDGHHIASDEPGVIPAAAGALPWGA